MFGNRKLIRGEGRGNWKLAPPPPPPQIFAQGKLKEKKSCTSINPKKSLF